MSGVARISSAKKRISERPQISWLVLRMGSVTISGLAEGSLAVSATAGRGCSVLIATLIDGIGFEILGAPICADGYNWWPVRILSRPDVQGWFAEGGPINYWITPRWQAPSQYDRHNNP